MPNFTAVCRLSTTPPGSISVARSDSHRERPPSNCSSMLLLPSTISHTVGVTGWASCMPLAQLAPAPPVFEPVFGLDGAMGAVPVGPVVVPELGFELPAPAVTGAVVGLGLDAAPAP